MSKIGKTLLINIIKIYNNKLLMKRINFFKFWVFFFKIFSFRPYRVIFWSKKCKKGPKQAFLALFEILDFCGKMAIFGGDLANPRRYCDRFEKFEKQSLKIFLKRRIRVYLFLLEQSFGVKKIKNSIFSLFQT